MDETIDELKEYDPLIDFNSEKDTSKISYSYLKDSVSKIKSSYAYGAITSSHLQIIIELLKKDSRKNVNALSISLENFMDNYLKEQDRVRAMYNFDLSFGEFTYAAGIDEVGRGPLAGPIAAAAVVLDLKSRNIRELIMGIKDSKQLSEKARVKLAEIIKEKAVSYNIAIIDNAEIDEKGIAWCNNEVFKRAVAGLKVLPDLVLSDGYPVKGINIKNEFIIKGDVKSASIACASIIAKVFRDNLMAEYSKEFPYYGFEKNSGYGSKEHIDAIVSHGPCKLHRKSFLRNII